MNRAITRTSLGYLMCGALWARALLGASEIVLYVIYVNLAVRYSTVRSPFADGRKDQHSRARKIARVPSTPGAKPPSSGDPCARFMVLGVLSPRFFFWKSSHGGVGTSGGIFFLRSSSVELSVSKILALFLRVYLL